MRGLRPYLLLQAWTLVSAQVRFNPPPPPPSPPSPPPPEATMICTFTPDASQPEIYYDLSLADEALTGNLRVAIKNQAGAITGDIYTRICRPPTVTCGQGSYACDSAQPPCISNPAAIDVYQNGAKCVAPGHLSNHVWSLQNPNDIKGGAQITFSGGDPARDGSVRLQRQYVMQFECDWSVNYPQAVSGTESTSASTITYTVVVRTSGACAIQPLPLSAGWISIILMGVSCFVYFVGGSVYNYKVRVRGQETRSATAIRAASYHPLPHSQLRSPTPRPPLCLAYLVWSMRSSMTPCAGPRRGGLQDHPAVGVLEAAAWPRV